MYWVTATKLCQAGMQRGEFTKEKQSDLSSVLWPPFRYLNPYMPNSSWYFQRKNKMNGEKKKPTDVK